MNNMFGEMKKESGKGVNGSGFVRVEMKKTVFFFLFFFLLCVFGHKDRISLAKPMETYFGNSQIVQGVSANGEDKHAFSS